LYLVEDKSYDVSSEGLQSIKYPFQCFIKSYKCPLNHICCFYSGIGVYGVRQQCMTTALPVWVMICVILESFALLSYLHITSIKSTNSAEDTLMSTARWGAIHKHKHLSYRNIFLFFFSKVLAVHRGWFLCQSIV